MESKAILFFVAHLRMVHVAPIVVNFFITPRWCLPMKAAMRRPPGEFDHFTPSKPKRWYQFLLKAGIPVKNWDKAIGYIFECVYTRRLRRGCFFSMFVFV